jgi:GNAT superfamily N-acetyltransferase
MDMGSVRIRRTGEADWPQVRALRLEMIRDTPTAFVESLEEARNLGPEEWRFRARRGSGADSITLAAITRAGLWVGTMGAYLPGGNSGATLVGVYVSPGHRGRPAGVADALLAGIEEWAHHRGTTLDLQVHEDNHRARAFYSGRGYRMTGVSTPYPMDPQRSELHLVKDLSPAAGNRVGRPAAPGLVCAHGEYE